MALPYVPSGLTVDIDYVLGCILVTWEVTDPSYTYTGATVSWSPATDSGSSAVVGSDRMFYNICDEESEEYSITVSLDDSGGNDETVTIDLTLDWTDTDELNTSGGTGDDRLYKMCDVCRHWFPKEKFRKFRGKWYCIPNECYLDIHDILRKEGKYGRNERKRLV